MRGLDALRLHAGGHWLSPSVILCAGHRNQRRCGIALLDQAYIGLPVTIARSKWGAATGCLQRQHSRVSGQSPQRMAKRRRPVAFENLAAAAIADIMLELTWRDDAVALRLVHHDPQPNRSFQQNSRRSPDHCDSRRCQPARAIRRPARFLERSRRHPLRTSRRHDRRRNIVKSADGLRLATRRTVSANRRTHAAAFVEIRTKPLYRDHRNATAPRHQNLFPVPLPKHPRQTESGTGKPILHQHLRVGVVGDNRKQCEYGGP